jgi:hypothetical protein
MVMVISKKHRLASTHLVRASVLTVLSIVGILPVLAVFFGNGSEVGVYLFISGIFGIYASLPLLFWGIPWHFWLVSRRRYSLNGYIAVAVSAAILTVLSLFQFNMLESSQRLGTVFFSLGIAIMAGCVFWYQAVYLVLIKQANSPVIIEALIKLHQGVLGRLLQYIVRKKLLRLLADLALYNDKGQYWSKHNESQKIFRRTEFLQNIQLQLLLLPSSVAIEKLQQAITNGELIEDGTLRFYNLLNNKNELT